MAPRARALPHANRTPPYGFLVIPFKDITTLRIYARRDDDPRFGFSEEFLSSTSHGSGKGQLIGPLALVALDVVVIVVQLPYYGIKYTYKAVQRHLDADPAADTAPACAAPVAPPKEREK